MPTPTKMELYTDLNKYAIDVLMKQFEMETKIKALENDIKNIKININNYYKQ